MREDLLVFDNEYKYAKDELKDYSQEICNQLKSYAASTQFVIENDGIKDENVIRALEEILSKIDEITQEVTNIGEASSKLCDEYTKTLDKDDDFLY